MKEHSYGIIPYIFTDTGVSILLSKSSKKSDYGFVKGKIDFAETPRECAVREVYEEIGIKVNINELDTFVFQKNEKKDIGLFYIHWDNYLDMPFNLNQKELYSVGWFNIKKLPKISKNQRKIITEILIKFENFNFYHKVNV